MHVDIDRYADLGTAVHRWDVRARLFSLFVLLFSVAFTRSLEGGAIALVLIVVLTLGAGIPVRAIVRRARWVLLILGPLALLLPLIGSAERSTTDHLLMGAAILVRGTALMVLTLPLFATARISETMAGMRALRLPSRLATIFLLAYRYVFVFLDDLRRMRLSMRSRGYEPRGGLRPLRVASGQVGSLIVRSFERNDRIYHSMQVRGFRGEFPAVRELRFTGADVGKSLVAILVSALLILGDVLLWQRW